MNKSILNGRIAFMIINNQILFLKDCVMSHNKWYKSLNLPEEKFSITIRGFVKDNMIIYYKGDFNYDDEVIEFA